MKKSFETILYSTLGLVAVAVILVAANFLVARLPYRWDLTAEKAYSLSKGTRTILANLDTPVQVRFYCTRNENMPPQLKLYAQQIEDLLNEYRHASRGKLQIQKLNPEPDSDAEDSAKLDGIDGEMLQTGEKLYLGLSVTMLDQKEAIPFLDPQRERLLEYDLSRAVSRVSAPQKAVVGIMSPLPVSGEEMNYMMMQMGRHAQEPWAVVSELKRDFTVKSVEMTADKIPDDVKVLMLVHPRGITETAEYAIDQFIMRGGKLVAFLDCNAVLDQQHQQNPMMGGQQGGGPSNLEHLLKAWGLSFDTTKTVADVNNLGRTHRGKQPGVVMLGKEALSKDDILSAGADNLVMIFPGVFSGTPIAGLKEAVLIKSSKNSQLVDPMMAQMAPEDVLKNFSSADKEYALAVRLTGKFKTAFPDGKPKDTASPDKDKDAKKDEKKDTTPTVKECKEENSVVLIGDSDMIQDQATVTAVQNPFTGQRMGVMPTNGNLAFAQSAVEQMTGDSNLIAVRSRATRERPFTVVKQMQADADASYRNQIKDLENNLAETQRKLNEMQQHREGDGKAQRFILSPEQQAELAKFRRTEADVKKKLKDVRRNLRADTDSLENRVKWINIAGMPFVVILAGIGFSIFKRQRFAAK